MVATRSPAYRACAKAPAFDAVVRARGGADLEGKASCSFALAAPALLGVLAMLTAPALLAVLAAAQREVAVACEMLRVRVVSVSGLVATDSGGTSDPLAVVMRLDSGENELREQETLKALGMASSEQDEPRQAHPAHGHAAHRGAAPRSVTQRRCSTTRSGMRSATGRGAPPGSEDDNNGGGGGGDWLAHGAAAFPGVCSPAGQINGGDGVDGWRQYVSGAGDLRELGVARGAQQEFAALVAQARARRRLDHRVEAVQQ